MFNVSSFGNGYIGPGMMYGGNFIDILLRHIMENGWSGFSILAIFNLYIYLSLDKIKDLFKYSNDTIGKYGIKILSLMKIYLLSFFGIIIPTKL